MIGLRRFILFLLIELILANATSAVATENQCRFLFESQNVQSALYSIDMQYENNILGEVTFANTQEVKWHQFKKLKLKKLLQQHITDINSPEKIAEISSVILDYFSPVMWRDRLIPTEKNRKKILNYEAKKILLQEGFEKIIKNSSLTYNEKTLWLKKVVAVLTNILSPWNLLPFLQPKMSTEYARQIILKGTNSISTNDSEHTSFLAKTYFQNYMKTLSQVLILTFFITAQIEQNRTEVFQSSQAAEQQIQRLDQIGTIANQFTKASLEQEVRRLQIEILLNEYEERFHHLPSQQETVEIENAVIVGQIN